MLTYYLEDWLYLKYVNINSSIKKIKGTKFRRYSIVMKSSKADLFTDLGSTTVPFSTKNNMLYNVSQKSYTATIYKDAAKVFTSPCPQNLKSDRKKRIFTSYGINENFIITSEFKLGNINYLMVLEVR